MDNNQNRELTLGEKRVAYSFNPNQDSYVEMTKRIFADLIDNLEEQRLEASPERNRTISRAQTKAEDTCMLMVKQRFQ